MRLELLAPLWALLLAGCGSSSSSASPPLVPAGATPTAVYGNLRDALVSAGHVCELKNKALVCDQSVDGRLTFVVIFDETPYRRVVVGVPSKMKVPCAQALKLFNKVNHDIDGLTLSCDEEGSFMAVGSLAVPDSGLTKADLNAFLKAWLGQLVSAIQGYALAEVIE